MQIEMRAGFEGRERCARCLDEPQAQDVAGLLDALGDFQFQHVRAHVLPPYRI